MIKWCEVCYNIFFFFFTERPVITRTINNVYHNRIIVFAEKKYVIGLVVSKGARNSKISPNFKRYSIFTQNSLNCSLGHNQIDPFLTLPISHFMIFKITTVKKNLLPLQPYSNSYRRIHPKSAIMSVSLSGTGIHGLLPMCLDKNANMPTQGTCS